MYFSAIKTKVKRNNFAFDPLPVNISGVTSNVKNQQIIYGIYGILTSYQALFQVIVEEGGGTAATAVKLTIYRAALELPSPPLTCVSTIDQ